jgi:hypothetical protein
LGLELLNHFIDNCYPDKLPLNYFCYIPNFQIMNSTKITLTDSNISGLLQLRNLMLTPKSKKNYNWEYLISILYSLNIGMEETLGYLLANQPSDDTYLNWIMEHASLQEPTVDHNYEKPLLSDNELKFWNDNGYIIIKNAINKSMCEDVEKAIWEFLGADKNDKDSWYLSHQSKRGMMLVFTQHIALHRVRHSVKIKKAFEQLYNTNAIYRTIDKVSFNAPVYNLKKFLGSNLHWDLDFKGPFNYRLQGLLYLSDVTETSGAFQCVPGFHHQFEHWLRQIPPDTDPNQYAYETLTPKKIVGNTGDFIIWNNKLPHSATPNYGKTPRLVQYLTYLPEAHP